MQTKLDMEFVEFRMKGTHQHILLDHGGCWFKRIGTNEDERIQILKTAHNYLCSKYEKGGNQMKGESYYLQLFQDLKENGKQWFDNILCNVL